MNDKFAGQCSELTERILACAYEVHARLGPGLLESAYGACLVHYLKKLGLHVETEVPIGIEFDELVVPTAYRADVIVERTVLLELKNRLERVIRSSSPDSHSPRTPYGALVICL